MSKEKLIKDLALGDGYISKPKSNDSNSRLVIKHSTKQTDYALYKKELLEAAGFKCSIDMYTLENGYGVISIRTMANIVIKNVRVKLYPNDKKTVSQEIIKDFDSRSLAILFQDNGAREHTKYHRHSGKKYAVKPYINCFVLHQNCFSVEENELVISKLLEMGIESRSQTRKGYPVIIISKVQAKERFVELIKPLLHPSMAYKIDTPVKYYGNL
jgi:hypothetical protein